MKDNKFVLPLIIILLVIFLPCALYGTYKHISTSKEAGNPKHLHKFENKLYYYDASDKLLGTYLCENDLCDDAKNIIDDEYLNYYEGNEESIDVFDNYVFIQDGKIIKLYNLKTSIAIAEYKQIKNYGTKIGEGFVIVQSLDNLYGLFDLRSITFRIPLEYDFLGVNERYIHENIDIQKYAVKKDNKWFIIDSNNTKVSTDFIYPIKDYTNTNVYLINDDKEYLIYAYNGNQILANERIANVEIVSDYNIVSTSNGGIKIYNSDYSNLYKEQNVFGKTYTYKIDDNMINIYDDDNLIDTFEMAGVE